MNPRLVLIAGSVVAAVAGSALVAAHHRSAKGSSNGPRVIARIPLGRGAPAPQGGGAFAVGDGAVWAMSDSQSTLFRIDPAKNAVVARIAVPAADTAAAGEGAVWLTYPVTDTVLRIDPARNAVAARIPVGHDPLGVAVAPGAVWVANGLDPSVSRIDPATNRVVATIRVGPKRACCATHMNLFATPRGLWVAVPNANAIVRIDPETNRVVGRARLPFPPDGFLIADERNVWTGGARRTDAVARIDARTMRVTGTLRARHPLGFGIASGAVWVALVESAEVDRIDPRTARVSVRVRVSGFPARVGVGFGSVWVNDDNGRVLRLQPEP